MKLYYSPGACSMASHLALTEAGLKFQTAAVDLRKKTFEGGDFKTVNPKGQVPALQLDNGEVLTEGSAILQYIADQKPEMKLVPAAGTLERYRCQEWLNYIATEVHKGFSPLWNPQVTEDARNQAITKLSKDFEFLNKSLQGKNFLMGAQYSIADAYLFTVLGWSSMVKVDLTPWSQILGFMERVGQRSATQAALKAEGLLH